VTFQPTNTQHFEVFEIFLSRDQKKIHVEQNGTGEIVSG